MEIKDEESITVSKSQFIKLFNVLLLKVVGWAAFIIGWVMLYLYTDWKVFLAIFLILLASDIAKALRYERKV